jgi:hypothetical protein
LFEFLDVIVDGNASACKQMLEPELGHPGQTAPLGQCKSSPLEQKDGDFLPQLILAHVGSLENIVWDGNTHGPFTSFLREARRELPGRQAGAIEIRPQAALSAACQTISPYPAINITRRS